jgi:hypothetical protein
MAKKIINVATPNSGTGDPLRNAFIKTNDNFTELYDSLGDKQNSLATDGTGIKYPTVDAVNAGIASATILDATPTVKGKAKLFTTLGTATDGAIDQNTANVNFDLKAPIASPTFTGTVNGITKSMVGLANVNNTSDENKPVSVATQTALDNKISGSGTTNQLPKFTANGVVGNSSITQLSNGDVGIGTLLPERFVDFTRDVNGDVLMGLKNKNLGNSARAGFSIANGEYLGNSFAFLLTGKNYNIVASWVNRMIFSSDSGVSNGLLIRASLGGIQLTADGSINNKNLFVATTGNVGINQGTPTERLDVVGNGKFSGTVILGQYTTATEPAYVKGAQFFNTTLNKMRIGGATAYETVTSS